MLATQPEANRRHIVINRLPIRPDADWNELAGKFDAFDRIAAQKSAAYRGVSLTRTDDGEGVILVLFTEGA
jgi:hypothetical protein